VTNGAALLPEEGARVLAGAAAVHPPGTPHAEVTP
jgi:hypothetical protein